MSEPTTDTTTTQTTEAAPPAPPEWLAKIDEPLRATLNAKGWADADPVIALGKVTSGYMNAEKAIGADKVVLPPKGADGKRDFAKWDGWAALGVPAEAKGYEFVKPEGFAGYSDDVAGAFRDMAHKARLTPEQAAVIHDAYVGLAQAGAATHKQNAERELASLQTEWGADFAVKSAQAKAGATPALQHAGLEPSDFDKIGDAIGHAKAVKMFQYYGSRVVEDRAVEGQPAGGGITRDPAQAKAEANALMLDAAYLNAKDPRHREVSARVAALFAVAHPDQQS